MDELVATMMQSGFSVAVAAFLLVRMEGRLEDLTLAIRELHGAILRGTTSTAGNGLALAGKTPEGR